MNYGTAGGYDAMARPERALWHAVDNLVSAVGVDRLRKLNVRAGEHLAALVTTCFLGIPPSDVDLDGGVDLDFSGNWGESDAMSPWLSDSPGLFEVKTLPGPFRKVDSQIDRAIATGRDPTGMGVTVKFEHASDIVAKASPTIARIDKQLRRKVDRRVSAGHGFIIVHPFDHLAIEAVNKFILGPSLPALGRYPHIDSLWILWAPAFVTVWSSQMNDWLNLMLHADDSEPYSGVNENLDVLQQAESYLLQSIGLAETSPYLVHFRN